jgi:hypothetical protein
VSTTFEINMVNESAGINDIYINTLASVSGIKVFVVGAEAQTVSVRDTGKTPGCSSLCWVSLLGLCGLVESTDNGVLLDEFDLGGKLC